VKKMNILISPLYQCNISRCARCWISEAGLERVPAQHSATEWIEALASLPNVGGIDVAGNGAAYPCVDSQRAKANCLGNIFAGTLMLPRRLNI